MQRFHTLLLMIFLATGNTGLSQTSTPSTPRKTSTFYPHGSVGVPKALQADMPALPDGKITAIAQSSNAVWIGTANGLIRYEARASADEKVQYLAGRRYLPDDHVLAISVNGDAGVWVRTETGTAYIDYHPIPLLEKARILERMEGERHFRHGLVTEAALEQPGDLSRSRSILSDNDGLWTSMYAAAECFRYRAEYSQAALERAHASLNAVLFLTTVTGIPGYPARTFVERGEPHEDGPDWHDSKDGRFRWKGDTSSDELAGHFFLYSVAYDLLPDRESRQKIRRTVRAIASNILDHDYNLVGESGAPTTWGRWSMDYFHTAKGRPDGPLNAIELLSFLKTAAHVTGDPQFEAAYRKAALDLGYAALCTRYLELREEINYSDEELFMLSIYPLMEYEKDPKLLAMYQQALDQWWQNEQREENPLWSYMYQSSTRGKSIQLDRATARLGRLPLNRVGWAVTNSTRSDVHLDGGLDRSGCRQATVLLPPDELPIQRWNGNPFCVDAKGEGRMEYENTTYLLPYWMARYLHYIK